MTARDLTEHIHFRLPPDLAEGLRELADADGRTVSWQLRKIVREEVERWNQRREVKR